MMNEPEISARSRNPGKYSQFLLWLAWVIWLPYMISPVTALTQSHSLLAFITLAGALLFIGLYMWASWYNARDLANVSVLIPYSFQYTWLPIISLVLLSIILSLLGKAVDSDLFGTFIYTTAYTCGRLPTSPAIKSALGIVLIAGGVGWLIHEDWSGFAQGAFIIMVVAFMVISLVRTQLTSGKLHAAQEEIARLAVTTERLRIARDLHDLLGHNLSLIVLKSELARKLLEKSPERVGTEIHDIEQISRTALQEVREAVASYRQPTLQSELHAAQEILAAAGITFILKSEPDITNTLPSSIETSLSWTLREGVTNVVKHSRAHQCTVVITRNNETVSLKIIDDGTADPAADTKGNGLRGLTERIEALCGQITAGPLEPNGYKVSISVPLNYKNTDASEIMKERGEQA